MIIDILLYVVALFAYKLVIKILPIYVYNLVFFCLNMQEGVKTNSIMFQTAGSRLYRYIQGGPEWRTHCQTAYILITTPLIPT